MAVCEAAPQPALLQLQEEAAGGREAAGREAAAERADHASLIAPNVPLALAVDYRSPRSHFLPPDIELGRRLAPTAPTTPAAAPRAPAAPTTPDTPESSASSGASPAKRKRGRPRVDRSSAEYVAAAAARKHAKETAAVMNSSGEAGEKRKRGRPRVDKTSPEYLAAAAARKRAKELEALERKAKRQYKRRTTGAIIVASKSVRVAKTRSKKAGAPPSKRTKLARSGAARKRATAKERQVAMRRKFVRRVRKKDSGASSSTGDAMPRIKRKYTRRAPVAPVAGTTVAVAGGAAGEQKKRGRKKKVALGPDGQPLPAGSEKARGRRGRRRKSEQAAAAAGVGATEGGAARADGTPERRGRPKLDGVVSGRVAEASRISLGVPVNSEPIVLDSDDEPGPGGESLSLDENLRALRHLHEKYAHLHLLRDEPLVSARAAHPAPHPAAHPAPQHRAPAPAPHTAPAPAPAPLVAVETLEDSSHSDSSSTSGSGSSSSGSSSSGSSSSSDTSDSSGDEGAEGGGEGVAAAEGGGGAAHNGRGASPAVAAPPDSAPHDSWFGGWAARTARDSDSASEGEGAVGSAGGAGGAAGLGGAASRDDVSESDNESPDKSFQCPLCRKWYSTNVTLKIHKRSHVARSSANSRWRRRTTGRYECDCCQLAFSCRENLLQHKAEAHRGAVTVRCEVCRRCFEDERELAAHDRTHTADERASRCGECGAQFSRWEQLRRHRSCAHPPPHYADGDADSASRRHPHACHVCGKAFGHAHSLTRHLANHTKAVYRCVVCKASFARADTLAQHLNSHLATYRRLKQ